eukprot:UN15941
MIQLLYINKFQLFTCCASIFEEDDSFSSLS